MSSSYDDTITMPDITSILAELGFDDAEVALYLTLLQNGPLPVAKLSKKLGSPRTTIYTMLARLTGRGLVRESARKGLKIYLAEPPDSVGHLFSQQLRSLEEAHKQFLQILPELRAARAPSTTAPRLAIMDGKEGLQGLLKDMLLYADITTCAVWPIKKMIEALSAQFFDFHNRERIKRNIYTRAVWPHDESVAIETYPFMGWGAEFKREVRIAPDSMSYALGYWIYADKVAFLSSARESYGFIIQSEELTKTLTSQFDLLWNASKPLEFNQAAVQSFLKDLRR